MNALTQVQKTEITPKKMRQMLAKMGLKVRSRRYSEFSEARVYDGDKQINGGNVLTPEHFKKYASFYAFKNNHSVIEDGWRTIL